MVASSVRRMLTSAPAAPSERRILRTARNSGPTFIRRFWEFSKEIGIGSGERVAMQPSGYAFGLRGIGILHTAVESGIQNADERALDLLYIPERQVGFVELAIGQLIVNKRFHQALDARGRRPVKASG